MNMRKRKLIIFTLFLMMFPGEIFSSPDEGTRLSGKGMFRFIPREAAAVFLLENRVPGPAFPETDLFPGEETDFSRFYEYAEKVGLNIPGGVNYAVFFGGVPEDEEGMGGAVVNLKYTREKFSGFLEEAASGEGAEVFPEEIEGTPAYRIIPREGDEPVWVSFPDKNNVVIGNRNGVESVLRVSKKIAEPLSPDSRIIKIIDTPGENMFLRGAVLSEKFGAEGLFRGHPVLKGVEGIELISVFAEYYEDEDIRVILTGYRPDEKANRELGSLLNGLKAFFMISAEGNEEFDKILSGIKIVPGPESIRISAVFPVQTVK